MTAPYRRGVRGRPDVGIYDTRHPANVFDDAGGRWVVVCETHSSLVNVDSLATARIVGQDVGAEFCEEDHEARGNITLGY